MVEQRIETRGKVVTYSGGNTEKTDLHEVRRIADLSRIIADMTGREFSGAYVPDHTCPTDVGLYFVPHKTILGSEQAEKLGIYSKEDLFGGVVRYPFMGTKAITHGLFAEGEPTPKGWTENFAQATEHVVLPGYTVFDKEAAIDAATHLVDKGMEVRGKRTLAAGGGEQHVVKTLPDLEPVLQAIPEKEFNQFGYVLESNLKREGLTIMSVGQVEIGGTTISYHGVQRELVCRDGNTRYAGSDLFIVRGGYDKLMLHVDDPKIKLGIDQARVYDKAAEDHLGVIASRRNYDVAQGYNNEDEFSSGVLEQSWRIGGASGPEILSIDVFRRDSSLTIVQGSSFNEYDAIETIPQDARVHFKGIDPMFKKPMATYSTIEKVQ